MLYYKEIRFICGLSEGVFENGVEETERYIMTKDRNSNSDTENCITGKSIPDYTETFCIGTFCFRLNCYDGITPPANLIKFAKPGITDAEYTYTIRIAETLPEPSGKIIARRPDLVVFETKAGEGRLLGVKGQDGFYGCYRELSEREAEVLLDPNRLTHLHIDPVFTSLLALERRMLMRQEMILHCAYVEYQGEAILFSAPSETGKTTQANLWEKYREARTVNGDRALLSVKNGQWTAGGWPVCGTSEICNNEEMPIRAIVMLRQAKENQVRNMRPFEAFIQLYSQITVNGWNRSGVTDATILVEQLIKSVPVYELGCTISEEAVECLWTALKLNM